MHWAGAIAPGHICCPAVFWHFSRNPEPFSSSTWTPATPSTPWWYFDEFGCQKLPLHWISTWQWSNRYSCLSLKNKWTMICQCRIDINACWRACEITLSFKITKFLFWCLYDTIGVNYTRFGTNTTDDEVPSLCSCVSLRVPNCLGSNIRNWWDEWWINGWVSHMHKMGQSDQISAGPGLAMGTSSRWFGKTEPHPFLDACSFQQKSIWWTPKNIEIDECACCRIMPSIQCTSWPLNCQLLQARSE